MFHRNFYTIEKHTLAKIFGLVFSIIYGFFVMASVQRHFILGSGDITAYVNFFEAFEVWTNFNDFSLRGEGVFRYAIFMLSNLLNQSFLIILGYLAFVTSSIIFCVYCVNVRSKNYIYHISPLIIMVFFTPRVMNLFASGIRSGIAFTILFIAIVYLRGAKKHILFGLSCIIHLSMIPIISLYFLYYLCNNKRIRFSFIPSLMVLLSYSFIVALVGGEIHISKGVSSSTDYKLFVFYIGLLIIYSNRNVLKDIHGFISVGIILIVLSGFITDFSFIRYVGNAIVFYLFFLIKRGNTKTFQVFTAGYAPFFILTLLYSITNHW